MIILRIARGRGAARLALLGLLAAAIVAGSGGCRGKRAHRKKTIDAAYVQAHLLAAPPAALAHRVDADLGGKVVYLGNEIVGGTPLAPGGKVTVKHYWKVIEAPGPGWRVFTHLDGAGGEFKNLDGSDMRTGHGPETWKAGEIIEDIQDVGVDAGWTSATATLSVGLYRKGSTERLQVVGGAADGKVTAAVLAIDVSRAPGTPPPYLVRRVEGPIAIDGRADEADWQRAASSPPFAVAQGSPALQGDATAKLLWDEQYLYVFVAVADDDVYSEFSGRDDTLWKADVVELFIDADGNRRGYVELQVNPNNAQLDSWFATTRAKPGDQSFDAAMTSAVVVRGTPVRGDVDQGWDVEIAIPLAAVKGGDAQMKIAIPPAIGDTWKLNVVRVDKPAEGGVAAASWTPISYRDFHAIDRLLAVTFGSASGEVPASPAAPASPAVPATPVAPAAPAPAAAPN